MVVTAANRRIFMGILHSYSVGLAIKAGNTTKALNTLVYPWGAARLYNVRLYLPNILVIR